MPEFVADRILIVRLSAIGDVLHTLPALCALRDARPNARLAWVVEGRTAELLAGHPALDELIVVPRRWLKSPRAVFELWRRVQGRFDVAIDVQGLTKSAVAARLSGARTRIGFAAPAGRELSPWFNNRLVTAAATHVVDRNLELLAPLDIRAGRVRFDLPERGDDAAVAGKIIGDLFDGRAPAIINPGAGWPSKLWSAERFAAVARHLGGAHRLPSLVVWAGAAERAWAEQIVAASAGGATLAPATTLNELAALARRAALFISSDTGPLHLAAAVDTPCIGLFGPMPAERNGPYGSGHISLQTVCLTGSSRSRRTANNDSMLAISVQQVVAACDEILSRKSDRQCA
jgi:lipopolysaccharide heptosyltransferase I